MACKAICKLCKRLVVSENIAVTDGTLEITLPTNTYRNGEKYCIVLAQTIPTTATLATQAALIINGGDTQFPLVTKCGRPVFAYQLRTRTRYSTVLDTTTTGAVFRLLGDLECAGDMLPEINAET